MIPVNEALGKTPTASASFVDTRRIPIESTGKSSPLCLHVPLLDDVSPNAAEEYFMFCGFLNQLGQTFLECAQSRNSEKSPGLIRRAAKIEFNQFAPLWIFNRGARHGKG